MTPSIIIGWLKIITRVGKIYLQYMYMFFSMANVNDTYIYVHFFIFSLFTLIPVVQVHKSLVGVNSSCTVE